MKKVFIILFIIFLVLTACCYLFQNNHRTPAGNIKTIYVEINEIIDEKTAKATIEYDNMDFKAGDVVILNYSHNINNSLKNGDKIRVGYLYYDSDSDNNHIVSVYDYILLK